MYLQFFVWRGQHRGWCIHTCTDVSNYEKIILRRRRTTFSGAWWWGRVILVIMQVKRKISMISPWWAAATRYTINDLSIPFFFYRRQGRTSIQMLDPIYIFVSYRLLNNGNRHSIIKIEWMNNFIINWHANIYFN